MKKLPFFYISVLLLFILITLVFIANRYPFYHRDGVFFNQIAINFLNTGKIAAPTAIHQYPGADEIWTVMPPLHPLIKAGWFKIFGYSLHTSLFYDLFLHLLIAGGISFLLWRLTRNQAISALYLVLSLVFIPYLGRPEHISIIFSLIPIILLLRGNNNIVVHGILLGLASACYHLVAFKGIAVFTILYFCLNGFNLRRIWEIVKLGLITLVIFLVIWLLAIDFRVGLFFTQMNDILSNSKVSSLDLFNYHIHRSREIFVTLVMFAFFHLASVYFKKDSTLYNDKIRKIVIGLIAGFYFCVGFNVLIGRHIYDYRLGGYLMTGLFLYLAYLWLKRSRYLPMKLISIASLAVLAFFTAKESADDYGYYFGKIFSGRNTYITFPEAKSQLDRIVPQESVVGGDSPYSMMRDGRKLYYIDRWLWKPGFPDYFIKSPDTTMMAIETRHSEYYDIIITPDSLTNIFGQSGGWDYYLLKKRETVNSEQ